MASRSGKKSSSALPLFRRKRDVIFAGILTALAALMLVPSLVKNDSALYAVIYCNGEVYDTVDLSSVKDVRTLRVTGKSEVTLRVENGSIGFEYSDCPDKLCIKSGNLRYKGQTAACLPAGVMIAVRSNADGGADVISY